MIWAASAVSAAPRGVEGALDSMLAQEARQSLGLGADAEVVVSELRVADPSVLRRAERVVSLEFTPKSRASGRVTAKAILAGRRLGATEQSVWLNARVTVRVPTVVAARTLARGTVLAEADMALALRELDRDALGAGLLAVGSVLRLEAAAGDVIRASALVQPALVKSGDRVTALVSSTRFTLRAPADALGHGALGATVSVRVLASGKVVQGTVVGLGQVEVQR